MNIKESFSFLQEYFNFEVKHELFDIKDKHDNYIWDVFRSWVYGHFRCPREMSYDPPCLSWQLSKFFKNIVPIFYTILPIKKKYFFFLQSRDNLGGKLFDSHSYDIYKILNPKECFLYETYFSPKKSVYSSLRGTMVFRGILSKFALPFIKADVEVCKKIYELLNSNFSDLRLSLDDFIKKYKVFYFDIWFYKKLLRLHKPKEIFIEGGSYHGAYFAAKKLGIKVTETQHGVVYVGHLTYSYPKYPDLKKKIYMPDRIVAMSDFWFSEFYMPMKKIVLGNDYFSTPVVRKEQKFNLIISNDEVGLEVIKLIKAVAPKTSEEFIFKLHPSEYYNVEFYRQEFKEFDNVKVYTNELSINALLQNTKKMIVTGSTCVYEALQAGVPVILYTGTGDYYVHNHVLGNKGICLFDTPEQLLEVLNQDIDFEPTTFFQPFNKEKALEMLNEEQE